MNNNIEFGQKTIEKIKKGVAFTMVFMSVLTGAKSLRFINNSANAEASEEYQEILNYAVNNKDCTGPSDMECEPINYSVNYEIATEYLDNLNFVINHDDSEEPSDYTYFWANFVLGKMMGASQKNIAVKIKNKEVITVDDVCAIDELCEREIAKEIFAGAREKLAQLYNAAFTNNKHNDYSEIVVSLVDVTSYIESKEGLLAKGEIWALNNAVYRVISEVSTLVVDYMSEADKAVVFQYFDIDTYLASGILVPVKGVDPETVARLKNEGCLCPIKAFIAEVLEAKDMIERINQRLYIGTCDFSGKSIIEQRQELFAMGLINPQEEVVVGRRRG